MINEYFNLKNDISFINYINETMTNDWINISEYDILFENVENETLEINEGIVSKLTSKVKNVVSTVLKFIGSLLKSIYSYIDGLFTSKKVKESFKKFKEECERDPSLKNKKVTITDYKKIMKEYDKKLQEISQKQHELRKDEKTEIDEFVSNFTKEVNNISRSITTIVSVDAMEKIAIANHEVALDIANKLKSDESILKNIEKEIGTRNAKKFEKNIIRASNDSILIKLKSIIYAKKYKTLSDTTSEIISSLDNIITGNYKLSDATNLSKIGKYTKNNETLKPYISMVKDGYKKGKKMEKEYKNKQEESVNE